jgi:hypothetical protein
MDMAGALLSPAVGGTMSAVSAGTLAYCSKKVKDELDERKVPLMGVLGAFLFAAQMINFSIPGSGSSGHFGGGLLLAILLGPHAAFLTIASVLVTAAIVSFVHRARPEMRHGVPLTAGGRSLRKVLLAFLAATVLTGGLLSWFASKDPDGLEWSIAQASGRESLPEPEDHVRAALAAFQDRIALLPDYAFRKAGADAAGARAVANESEESRLGSSVAGLVGGLMVLVLAFLIGFLLKRWRQPA